MASGGLRADSGNMKQVCNSTIQQGVMSKTNHEHVRPRIYRFLFTPVLAPLVQDRRITLILMGVAALQVWLTAIGFPGWQCPIKSSLGISCPGCGLSSAIALLIQGQWQTAVSVHAFAPVFLIGSLLLMVAAVLPERLHRNSVRWIAWLERCTGIIPLLLISITVYWVLRFPK
ncbi:MAG: DUF2752 domain-containing protein [Desulfobacteraceae bacterium]|nr:MAG: DUF2752 domain-containing protein [Desulfobacteraceae bacterium]